MLSRLAKLACVGGGPQWIHRARRSTNMSGAWRHFWQLERPSGPTPRDLLTVLEEMGVAANLEEWSGPTRTEQDRDQATHFMRIRLCLPPERETEVRDFLVNQATATERSLATVWWDVR